MDADFVDWYWSARTDYPSIKRVASHEIALLDLIDAVENKRQPLCDEIQGRTTVEMVTAAFESHRLNGERVTWPLSFRDNPFVRL